MLFEIPFILICITVCLVLCLFPRKIEINEQYLFFDKNMPLPELAEWLLIELDEINQLEPSIRVVRKKQWKDRYEAYLERKKIDLLKNSSKENTIRAIK